MVSWVGALARALERQRAPSPFLLPLMVLWANLHGGFTFGLILLGGFGLEAVVSAPAGEHLRRAAQWIAFAVAALVCACITPYGPESILVTFRIRSLRPALQVIDEWRPPDFSHIGGLELALLAGLGLALWHGFVLSPVRILILVGLLHL